MENKLFVGNFAIETSPYMGVPIAMFDYRMVFLFFYLVAFHSHPWLFLIRSLTPERLSFRSIHLMSSLGANVGRKG